jgi:hypothetical protein
MQVYTTTSLVPTLSLQEKFVSKVSKMIQNRKEESQEVLKGWFTPQQMKAELQWDQTLSPADWCRNMGN